MSASMATTGSPRAARWRTNSEDSVVLPLPPLPANAIFIGSPCTRSLFRHSSPRRAYWNDYHFHVRIREVIARTWRRDIAMSLSVPADLLGQARRGDVD